MTVVLGAAVFFPLIAVGSVIPVVSYSMNNGGTGSFDYRDTSYLPCPANNCSTTGAALSGGTGKLTDGVQPTVDWSVGPPEGWVGWSESELNGTNPMVNFILSGTPIINSIVVWFDNTLGGGGVGAPASISVNGTSFTGIPQSVAGPQAFTISGLNITSNNIAVQFFQGSNPWVMIGEVTFNSAASAVPEPVSPLLMLIGLTALLLLRGRLRKISTS